MVQAIADKIEDLEDLYLAEQVLLDIREGRSRTFTLAEVEEQLGLVD